MQVAALFAYATETATGQAEAQSGHLLVKPTPLHLDALHPALSTLIPWCQYLVTCHRWAVGLQGVILPCLPLPGTVTVSHFLPSAAPSSLSLVPPLREHRLVSSLTITHMPLTSQNTAAERKAHGSAKSAQQHRRAQNTGHQQLLLLHPPLLSSTAPTPTPEPVALLQHLRELLDPPLPRLHGSLPSPPAPVALLQHLRELLDLVVMFKVLLQLHNFTREPLHIRLKP